MHRLVVLCLLFLACIHHPLRAQTPSVKVKVRAALYDRDLNMKPVPHLALTFRNLDLSGPETSVQTSLDGAAEVELTPGRYQVSSGKPTEFQGRTYLWDLQQQFSKPENVLELSNDNAKVTDLTGGRNPQVDSLAEHFRVLKGSAVTVWAQDGHGTGFLVDPAGLIVTNQHVTAGFTYLAVQFDGGRKLAAELLAEDKQKDVSVLRVNLAAIPDAVVAPLAEGRGVLLEGERVFTIGNPLDQEKVLTTGVVSKVDQDSIISDISISAGNSGGPLFNSSGVVVGITTYRTGRGRGGSGLSGITPISKAADVLASARTKAASTPPPSARWLPVAPPIKYPADALRAVGDKPWQKEIYFFKLGNFDVEIVTPVTRYQAMMERTSRAEKERQKRAQKSGAPAEAPQQPAEYETQYDSVVRIDVSPQLKLDFWKSMTPGGPVIMKFKSDFQKMKLLCDSSEIEPILPGRYPVSVRLANGSVYVDDATFEGAYTYPPDAISPKCKQVSLEVVPVKEQDKPLVKILDQAAVTQISSDFEPFRKALEASVKAPAK